MSSMMVNDSLTTYLTRHQPTSVLDRTNLNTVNSRGSHLCRTCRSVCDQDKNPTKPFSGADQGIKVASGLLKSTDQERAAAIWPLTLKNQLIKRCPSHATAICQPHSAGSFADKAASKPLFRPFVYAPKPAIFQGTSSGGPFWKRGVVSDPLFAEFKRLLLAIRDL